MSLLDKFKSLTNTKLSDRELLKNKKAEMTNVRIPQFAKLRQDRQLECILCEIIVKNEAAWIKHVKSEDHITRIENKKQISTSSNKIQLTKDIPNFEKESIPSPEINITESIKISKNENKDKISFSKIKNLIIENSNSPTLPEGFFDTNPKPSVDKSQLEKAKTLENKEINEIVKMKDEIIYEDPLSDTDLNEDVETMIECSKFIKNLISKKESKLEPEFQYLLQKEENVLAQNYNRNMEDIFLTKKRNLDRKINILKQEELVEEKDDLDLFELDWRNQS